MNYADLTGSIAAKFKAMPEFHRSFIIACLEIADTGTEPQVFFSCKDEEEFGGIPAGASYWMIDDDGLQKLFEFAESFYSANKNAMDAAFCKDGYSQEQAGYDLLLSTLGAGTGFTDRDALPEGLREYLHDRASSGYSDVDLYAYVAESDTLEEDEFTVGVSYIHAGFSKETRK